MMQRKSECGSWVIRHRRQSRSMRHSRSGRGLNGLSESVASVTEIMAKCYMGNCRNPHETKRGGYYEQDDVFCNVFQILQDALWRPWKRKRSWMISGSCSVRYGIGERGEHTSGGSKGHGRHDGESRCYSSLWGCSGAVSGVLESCCRSRSIVSRMERLMNVSLLSGFVIRSTYL